MFTAKRMATVACAALLGSVAAGTPNLSGRWELNAGLSENAQEKLEKMQPRQDGGHGPGRHGLGSLFGGGPDPAQMEEARGLLLDAPTWFTVVQSGDRIVFSESDGRARTLTANGRKEKVDGRELRTRWDKDRLVAEISLGAATIVETYERLTDAQQLIVTTKMAMHGNEVAVRRVYDSADPR